MPKLTLRTASMDMASFQKIVADGISAQRKKIEYALNKTNRIIKCFEEDHQMTSKDFLQRFQGGDVEENSSTFDWWSELKVAEELEEKLHLIENIEIC